MVWLWHGYETLLLTVIKERKRELYLEELSELEEEFTVAKTTTR